MRDFLHLMTPKFYRLSALGVNHTKKWGQVPLTLSALDP